VQLIARVRRSVPLRVVDRLATRLAERVLCLLTEDAAPAVRQLRFGVVAFVAQRVGRVVVRADEIDR